MSGLADLFSAEDFQAKGKKTKAQKGADKKGAVTKGIRYPLPVRVCAGHIRCVVQNGTGAAKTASEDEIKKKIREEYPELSGVDFGLVKFDNSFTKAIEAVEQSKPEKAASGEDGAESSENEQEPLDIPSASEDEEESCEDLDGEDTDAEEDEASEEEESGEEEDEGKSAESLPGYERGCWVKLEIHYEELKEDAAVSIPVMIKVGSVEHEYDDEFESLDAVREHFVSLHPEFAGCRFHYDEKQDYLLPFMRGENEIKGKKYKLPLTVGYLGLSERYEAKDFGSEDIESVTLQQVRNLYAKKYPEFENAIFAYQEEGGYLFPVINFTKKDGDALYSVPVKVRGGGFILDLESSDFGGKAEVTLEQVRKALEEVYPEFSKERTEMIYDERGFVIPVLKGSRKGYRITGTVPGRLLLHERGRNGMMYRIEKNPFGCFDCREDGEEVDFRLEAPKIPGALLDEIIAFFKKDPAREAAVQIFYDEKKREYELYYPAQRAGSVSVDFERNTMLEEEKLLVMDVHSHNRMNAFFSGIDDNDEKGTRLFLVIGRIDRNPPAWCFRAGIAGHYKGLQLWDIFTKEGVRYEL